MEQQGHQNGVT